MPRPRRKSPVILLIAFVLLLLLWMTVQVRSGKEIVTFPSPVAPLQKVFAAFGDGIGDLWKRYTGLRDTERRNKELEDRLEDARTELLFLQELEEENARLRKLLSMQARDDVINYGVSRIVSRDPTGWSHVVVIDRGRKNGLRPGQSAVSPDGLVGRIVSVTDTTSRVLLISDPRSAVAVRLSGSRADGILEGMGTRLLRLVYVSRERRVHEGEAMVTTGLDGIYPPGIPVAVVDSVRPAAEGLFQRIRARPLADISRLEEVAIVGTKPQ